MAITYPVNVKQARMQATLDLIDKQTAAGKFVIYDASNVVICSLPLSKPSAVVTTVSNAVSLQFTVPFSVISDNAGTADHAAIVDGNGNPVITGLRVGTSNADVILASTTIAAGANVQITSAVITHG
jgi:hypothetical protein